VLTEVITVLLAVFNAGIALYVLKRASAMFKSEPEWLNDFVEDKKISLMESFVNEDENGNSFMDAVAQRFGQSLRMSLMAQKSGEVRKTKAIEGRVFEAVKENSPELKIGLKALEHFGLGDLATPENLPALMQVAQKWGLFGSFINRNDANPNRNNGNVPLM